ncbi:MAG: pilus assembly PilX N-terminal domain-containing protein [Elusimicrobia bacterium]|nr:pilus assembly PilX N-terminal domain-containing protein [Elusimicrobiota bacterium]
MIKIKRRAQSGQVMIGAIIVLAVLLILTPALIFLAQHESRMAVKHKRAISAFFAAEAGVERALWLLRSSSSTFDNCLNGAIPAGYLGDAIYADVPEAAYAVWLSSTATKYELRIESRGRDSVRKEFRTIEVYVKKDSIEAAIYAPSVDVWGSAKVIWGPLMSMGDMEMQGSANEMYPRKLARGKITRTGGGGGCAGCTWAGTAGCGYCDRDTSPTPLNTDSLEFWAYNSYPVPDPPQVDLEYYRGAAKAETGCPAGGTQCTPAGNTTCCYYTANQLWDNHLVMAKKVYFFEGNAKFTGSKHFRGHLMAMGDLEFEGSGKGDDGSNEYGSYISTPPATAWREYQKNVPQGGDDCRSLCTGILCGGGGNGANDDGNYNDGNDAERDDEGCHQFPGDEGYRTVHNFKFGTGCINEGHSSNIGGGSSEPISFKGFAYVKGETKVGGSVSIHGSLMSDSGRFAGGGSMVIWYDDSLDVHLTSIDFKQTSWKELPGKPF